MRDAPTIALMLFFAAMCTGAEEWFAKRPPCNVFMEYHTRLLKAAGGNQTPADLRTWFGNHGYVTDANFADDNKHLSTVHWVLKQAPATQAPACVCQ